MAQVQHHNLINGLIESTRPEFEDSRGSLMRVFTAIELENNKASVRQTLISKNHKQGTLRGFHWQAPPHGEAKWLIPLSGSFFVAFLDLRKNSSTYLYLAHRTIRANQRQSIYVPEDCATGYLTLEDNSSILYHLFNDFQPESAKGFRWNDSDVNCPWPIEPSIISDKDQRLPSLKETLV